MSNIFVYHMSIKKFVVHSNIDLEKIASLDIESSFDYELDNIYYCYVISNEMEINKYKKILNENIIDFTCEDISFKIINNDYDISYIHNNLDKENYYIYKIFLDDLEEWIYCNLELDIILDMISFKGIESLRNVDKRYLKDKY